MIKRVKGVIERIFEKNGNFRFLRLHHNIGLRYIIAFVLCTKLINMIWNKLTKEKKKSKKILVTLAKIPKMTNFYRKITKIQYKGLLRPIILLKMVLYFFL